MLLMIDNYDSFTYNLVQYFGELGEEVQTFRNDEITLDEIAKLNPERICLSPGPSNPQHAGITLSVLREFSGKAAHPRRMPRPSGHWRSVRRTRGSRANHHARQGQRDRNRLPRRVFRLAQAFQRDALSLAGHRGGNRCPIASKCRRGRPMAKSWACVTRNSRSKACSFIRNRSCPSTGMRCWRNFVKHPAQGKRA